MGEEVSCDQMEGSDWMKRCHVIRWRVLIGSTGGSVSCKNIHAFFFISMKLISMAKLDFLKNKHGLSMAKLDLRKK